MAWIRQDKNGNTISYALPAPPTSEAELWIKVADDDLRVRVYFMFPAENLTMGQKIAFTQKMVLDRALGLLGL